MELTNSYYIGWDVGGWNCDKNPNSRDALVIINSIEEVVGVQWRGNLRKTINNSTNAKEFIEAIFGLCGLKSEYNKKIIMAIDAPLGFSIHLKNLIDGTYFSDKIENHNTNPYLFRKTEQLLFKNGITPLSSIKDMIGSQTTKAMHVVRKFTSLNKNCSVFTDKDKQLTIIETYPSACKDLIESEHKKSDENDALICAKIAKLFDEKKLQMPIDGIPEGEGWIWTTVNVIE